MQTLISSLPQEEILRYLGHRGSALPSSMQQLLEDCIAGTLQTITPNYRYQAYTPVFSEHRVWLGSVELTGNDIVALLQGCHTVYLMAVTLGLPIERTIRTKMLTAPDQGVIYDSCASAAVEVLADLVEEEIRQTVKEPLTMRYSPGYGDLPLEVQGALVRELDTHRKIGLTTTESLLLTPGKSVTAILGVGLPNGRERPKCETCTLRGNCAFRKRGTTC